MEEQIIYLLCGLLGMSIQFFTGMESFKKQAKAANFVFVFKKYLEDDFIVLIRTVLTIILAILIFPNVLKVKPEMINYSRVIFGFVGWAGANILQLVFSPTQKKIQDIISKQADIVNSLGNNITSDSQPQNPPQ